MRFLLLALLVFGCATGESDPTASPSPWVFSHTLDLREETTGCVSVASLSDNVALKCSGEGDLVERCDDTAKQTVDVYAMPGVENVWTHLRMKSCEAP